MNIRSKKYQNVKNNFQKDITLNLLDVVEKENETTQLKISSELGIAVGLANSYLKRCVNKGWVKVKNIPLRRYAYYLTPKGFAMKSKLTAEYLYSSFEYFRQTKKEFEEITKICEEKKLKKILIVGEGDLSDIATLFLKNSNLELNGITNLKNFKKEFKIIKSDCVWITDINFPQETFNLVKKEITKNLIFFPKILGINKGNK